MGIENSYSPYDENEPQLGEEAAENEVIPETPKDGLDFLIFDAPFHFDGNLNALDDSGKGQEIPRGALSVATMLERHGFNGGVVPMDAFMESSFEKDDDEAEIVRGNFFSSTEQESTLELQDKVVGEAFLIAKMRENLDRLIREYNPRVVAFSYMFSPTERLVLAMIRYVRENFPDKLIMVGGNAATLDTGARDKFLDPEKAGVDLIVNAEGEWTMLEIMEAIKNGDKTKRLDLSKIAGISYWNGDKIVKNDDRKRGNPMEVGPLNYDKVILPEGTSISDFNHYVLFARGCLGSCLFCTSRAIYKHWITSIGLESFRSELEYVAEAVSKRKRGEKTIGILDDDLLLTVLLDAEGNITNDEKQAVDSKTVFDIIAPVLEDVNRMYPEISFIAQARVGHLRYFNESMENDRVNDPTLIFRHLNTLNQMKECGIDMVLLGIESGSQKILDASVKQTRVEWVKPACMRLHEAGIEVGAFWIVGLPGATFEEEEKSLEILEELVEGGHIDELEAHVFELLPGTPAYKDAHREVPKNNIRLDEGEERSNEDLFSGVTNYEHVDKDGNVVLSKAQLQSVYARTKKLVEKLKVRKASMGKKVVVKQ